MTVKLEGEAYLSSSQGLMATLEGLLDAGIGSGKVELQ